MTPYRREWCYWDKGMAYKAALTKEGKWHYSELVYYYPVNSNLVPLTPCIMVTDLFVNTEAPVWNSDGTPPLYASPILPFHRVK